MPSLFYEDVEVGQQFHVAGRTVTEFDLAMFAMVSGDMHPLHTNQAYAEKTSFGGRIAHGPFGVALAMGLFCRIPEFAETAIALTDIRNWFFRVPVYLGDTLDLEMKIAGKRITRSGKGVVDRDIRLVKSDGTVAQEGTMGLLISMRTDPDQLSSRGHP